ncbi:hypothetical protein AB0K08_13480 [Citricoccus sp. NPDC055426]|uniref:hypothetical protein n=1 Tax=Citricoccus sp. NPDC055426 TaxID=3155536 RepID=UPI00344318FE
MAPIEGTIIEPGTPTQVAHPAKATVRTVVQTLVAVAIGVVVLGPPIIDAILAEPLVPDELRGALLAVSAVVVAIGGIATRIMAIPGVNRLLERIGLGTGVENEPGRHEAVTSRVLD